MHIFYLKSYKNPSWAEVLSFEQSIIIFEFNLQQSAFQHDIFLPFLPQLLVNKIDSKKGIFCNFLDLNTLRFFDKFSSNLFKLFIQDFWHFLLNISTTFYIKLFSFSFIRQFFLIPMFKSKIRTQEDFLLCNRFPKRKIMHFLIQTRTS